MSVRQETTFVANERIIYTIRRSRRAKHMLLHVDAEGVVEVVVPWGVAWGAAEKFVQDKQAWLQGHLHKRPTRVPYTLSHGSTVPLLDEKMLLTIVPAPERQRAVVRRHSETLVLVMPPGASVRHVLETWYRRQAELFFGRVAQEYAALLGVSITRIAIGNHRTQWGSCSARGRLSFNWRLLLGPSTIAQYVAAHEVAHLVHHNHSPQYWGLVSQLYPDYAVARRFLREEAGSLRW